MITYKILYLLSSILKISRNKIQITIPILYRPIRNIALMMKSPLLHLVKKPDHFPTNKNVWDKLPHAQSKWAAKYKNNLEINFSRFYCSIRGTFKHHKKSRKVFFVNISHPVPPVLYLSPLSRHLYLYFISQRSNFQYNSYSFVLCL